MAGPAWRIVAHDALPSTNDAARALAEAGDPGWVAVVARSQTAGRGRRGRTWVSPPGGLYVSALARPDLPADQLGLVPLAGGLALARLVAGLGAEPVLRWPNDVFLGNRKVGGVLCESRLRADGRGAAWVVVGLGLNVATPADALAPVDGTSLRAHLGQALDPAALVAPLLAELATALAEAALEPQRMLEAWAARAPMLGGPVIVLTEQGSLEGTATLDPSGALQVLTSARTELVHDPALVRVIGP